MRTKRVLVWANGLVLGALVESLLVPEVNLEVIGIEADGRTDLPGAIERHHPDVVILGQCELQKDTTILAHLLLDYPDLRVIMIGSNDNRIHLYHQREILITQASDLANLIRSQ